MAKRQGKSTRSRKHSRLVRKWDGRPVEKQQAGTSKLSIRALRAQLEKEPGDAAVRLALADRLLSRNKPEEVCAVLDAPESPLLTGGHDDAHWAAVRMQAFALAKLQRFDAACQLADNAIAEKPDALDFHYIIAYAAGRDGGYTRARIHAQQFIGLHPQAVAGEIDSALAGTAERLHEVYNYLGVALEQEGQLDEAIAAFEAALQERRDYDISWVNLIRCLTAADKGERAATAYREAVNACPRSKTLASLRKKSGQAAHREPLREAKSKPQAAPGTHKPTIALCMIVKNEEEHLTRCLTSAKPLVDQMIVVDTGSTDRTVEIAKSFGASVYHHEWEGNFSKARNISIGYADADWVLILDADEELVPEDFALIRKTLQDTEFRAVSLSVYNYSRLKKMYTSFLPSVRLFRRDMGAFYEGIVHNQLRFPSDEGVLRIPARINHYGYGLSPEVMARKVARTQALLEQQLRENPDNAFAHFNLAQLLRGSEEVPSVAMMDKVIHHAERAVALSSPDHPRERHIHIMALHQLVTAHFNKGSHKRAAEYAHQALAHKPGYLDAILSLGHIHSMDGQLDLARKYYLEYLDRQQSYDEHAETDHVILLHLRSRHNALYGIGLVAEMQGDTAEAIRWYERCIDERDDYIDVHYRLAVMLLAVGQNPRAREELRTELEHHPENVDARVALAEMSLEEGDWAGARVCLRDGLAVAPRNSRLSMDLAKLEYRSKRFKHALSHLETISPTDPAFGSAQRLRADALYELGEYARASVLYDECLKTNPHDFDLLNNQGNCHFRLGEYNEAEAIYRQIIDAGKADTHVYRNLGVTQARMEKVDDAIFTLESYAEMKPDDVETFGFLGDLHFKRQDFRRAIDDYERVLERQPNRPDTLTRLGDCYLQQGALAAALLGYERALEADPEYSPAWSRVRQVREFLVARLNETPAKPS